MKKLINVTILILSILLLLILFWFRYIRERLPREIPFNLSLIGFLLLLIICISSVLSIISFINKKLNIKGIYNVMYEYLYIPLRFSITFLINNELTLPYFRKYFVLLLNFIKTLNYHHIYMMIELIPMFIIASTFVIDVFYFHCLKYFYTVILLSIPIFVVKYILLILKHVMNNNIHIIDEKAELFCINIINPREPGVIPLLSANEFVHEQTQRILNNKDKIDYFVSFRLDYVKNEKKRRNIPDTYILNTDKFEKRIQGSINMAIALYKMIYVYEQEQNKYKKIKIIIYSLYGIGWIYILIVSIHTLSIENIQNVLFMNIEEPFSGIYLREEYG